jgi:hypothetical protein
VNSRTLGIVAAVIAVVAGLALLRFKPWQRGPGYNDTNAGVKTTAIGDPPPPVDESREKLTVGFLPVT